ncbi:ribosomal protein L2 [Pseudovirgaria hyperparasitica]|uniref:Ribosomal protein L2 n=1 Tax=Pseudovirgaria hyperparasitica TaxID=470096 RepID=A0A6A6WJJ3_9PEZI|nr:ribosomal protein L2 [Pseudovirgaria hyperparasitica]KAF2761977.1 ribosomal protein L2 [Pseudovirgaria hyperparasitica]
MLQPRIPLWRCFQQSTNSRSFLRTYATSQKTKPRSSQSDITSTDEDGSPKKKYSQRVRLIRSDEKSIWLRGITNSTRNYKRQIFTHLWKGGPYKPLTYPKKGMAKGGRNNQGRVCVRHRGGGHKRRIRILDFHRKEPGRQIVERIEYDPNRTAHIALLKNEKTKKRTYIVAADGMMAGDTVESFMSGIPARIVDEMGGTIDPGILASKTIFTGNCLPIFRIPPGTQVYNVGSKIGGKAVFCRTAGSFATVTQKNVENESKLNPQYQSCEVQLASGEIRKVSPYACATIGRVSNHEHHKNTLGKAGRSRWKNIRPTVRGMAMNAADHPHGGGRGKSKGKRIPQSPWGQQAKSGFKTRRKRNRHTFLVKDRERNMGKRRAPKGTQS